MNKIYTAVIKKEGDWWIGWIQEVPGGNCQERSHEELMESLRIRLKEALEFNRQEVLSAAEGAFQEESDLPPFFQARSELKLSMGYYDD